MMVYRGVKKQNRGSYFLLLFPAVLLCWLTLSGCENKKNLALSEYWASDSQAAESL